VPPHLPALCRGPRAAGLGRWAGAVAGGFLLAACASERAADEVAETVPVPAQFAGGSETPAADAWFRFFEAPELERLVARGLTENFDLRTAWARLAEADALARQAGAARYPRITAEAGVRRERSPARVPGGGGARETFTETVYRGSLGARYEFDLWGRLRDTAEAAALQAEASRADRQALAMTLAANITGAWLDLVELRARARLLEAQQALAGELLALAERRLGQGMGSALDVTEQERELQALRASEVQRSLAAELARHRLAVLVGTAPQEFSATPPATLPALSPTPPTGLPAALLERRPDLRAARARLMAADAETAAAVAARLPSLRLDARLFAQATSPAELLETLFWSLGGAVEETLFSGGREAAEIDAAEARARQALYDYAGTMLTALREVADALAREEGQERYLARLRGQLESAREALSLARERYGRGAADYQRVLGALSAVYRLERDVLAARRERLAARVELHRALGGRFPSGLRPAPPGEGPSTES
jgi:outer membrane protein, multidrug efflux system